MNAAAGFVPAFFFPAISDETVWVRSHPDMLIVRRPPGLLPTTRPSRVSALERRESVCQPRRLTRCRFRRADRGAAEPRTLEMPKPAGRAGHEHPAEGRGNCVISQIPASPNSGPFRKSLFLAVGMFVPASDRRGLRHNRGTPAMPSRPASPRRDRPLPLPPMTATTPMPRCRATPCGCWSSCSIRGRVPPEPGRPSPKGSTGRRLPATLRRLVEAELLSRHRGQAPCPDAYRLHCRRAGR